MKRLIYLLVLAVLVSGCATTATKSLPTEPLMSIAPAEFNNLRKDQDVEASQIFVDQGIEYEITEQLKNANANTINHSSSFGIEDTKNLRIGMTKKELLAVEGEPNDINKTVSSSGVREQWVYGFDYRTYVYFTNGILTSWQD